MRRLASNAAALRRLIETDITVGAVSEELYCVEESDISDGLWDDLRRRGFDRCGVRQGGRITGYVERTGVSGVAGDIRTMSVDQLVAETTPLWEAMLRLAESRWLFVLTPAGPDGIATAGDLAKQPARLLMFGVISLLEMTMLTLIRQTYPDGGWLGMLKPQRVEHAKGLLQQRQQKGQDIDLADCLQWCDKAAVCMGTPEVRSAWAFQSKAACRRVFRHAESLRNQLAHAQHPAPDGDWCRVVHVLRDADRLITANLKLLGMDERDD